MRVISFTLPDAERKTVITKEENLPYFYPYLHNHQEIQLTYITSGEGSLLIGNNVHRFKSNEIYLIGANHPHVFKSDPSYFSVDNKMRVSAYTIFFSMKGKLASLFNLPELRNIYSFYANHFSGFKISDNSVKEISTQMMHIRNTTGIDQIVEFFQLLKLLSKQENLTSLSTKVELNEWNDYDSKRLSEVLGFIKENHHKDLTLEEVAAKAYITPEAFCRYFKKHTRVTFLTYLNDYRINQASKMLLEDSSRSIASIAYNCGFKSINNFNRAFKKAMRKSPTEYLNSFRQCECE